jgi:hypothetical protein
VKSARALLVFGALASGLFTGCGYVGDPKAPALDMPMRVTDFRAAEYGENILVQFSVSPLTTEGLTLTKIRSVELRVEANNAAKTLQVPPKDPGPFTFEFPAKEWVGKKINLAVRAVGPKGKASEWSNPASVDVGNPLPKPANLKVENAPKGVRLSWQATGKQFRIFRGTGDMAPARLAESDKSEYVDTTAESGMRYRYFVQRLEGDLRQSEVSSIVEITPVDEFPPAVPAGLSAVAGVNSIELAWERNTEDDFAGYNVYRAVGDGTFEKIAGPIDAPTFSDRTVLAGTRYRYVVTSVDNVGNESARSMVADAVAQ